MGVPALTLSPSLIKGGALGEAPLKNMPCNGDFTVAPYTGISFFVSSFVWKEKLFKVPSTLCAIPARTNLTWVPLLA